MFYRRNVPRFWSYATTLALSIAASATAQEDIGSIGALIVKEDGRPLAGVSIFVESRDAGTRHATTGATGRASVDELAAGLYLITASLAGYVRVFSGQHRESRVWALRL